MINIEIIYKEGNIDIYFDVVSIEITDNIIYINNGETFVVDNFKDIESIKIM